MASLHPNRHGYLQIRFLYDGIQCSGRTKIKAKKINGRLCPEDPKAFLSLKRWVDEITKDVKSGTFDYLAHFPHGNKADLFHVGGGKLFEVHVKAWLKDKEPPELRLSTHKDYTSVVNYYLLPFFKNKLLSYFTTSPEGATATLKKRLKDEKVSPQSHPNPQFNSVFDLRSYAQTMPGTTNFTSIPTNFCQHQE